MNKYMPTKAKAENKWYKHDLMSYIYDLKYKQFIENADEHFQKAKIINFDIIQHKSRGDELEYLKKFYQTIENKDFKNYDNDVKEEVLTSGIKWERKDVYINTTLIKKKLISNSIFVKRSKRKKKVLMIVNH